MKSLRRVGVVALLLVLAHALWSRTGRGVPESPRDPGLEVTLAGHDEGAGNLLAVQPYMVPADYSTAERFQAKLDAYLAAASSRGLLNERTVAVFPEYLGTWLAALGEKASVYRSGSVQEALRIVAFTHPVAYTRALLTCPERDRAKAALFRMKAATMAAGYQDAFARLAARWRITIVAGSIVLPSPRVEVGRLVAGDGSLENVSAVFRPDGGIEDALVRKAYPIEEEKGFVAACSPSGLPVFATPAGRLGVLICADSWHPESYRALRAKKVELLVVPSYLADDDCWNRPWRGYDGAPAPSDVDPSDLGRITEGRAWSRYALLGRYASSGARAGVNVFLRGALWDLGDDGRSVLVSGEGEGKATEGSRRDGPALLNQWVPAPPRP
jgi:predicted amidohydrolase